MKCYRDRSMTTGNPNLIFHVDLAGYCWFFRGTNWGSGTTGEGLSFLVVDERKVWPANIQIDSKVLRPALGHMNAKVDGFVNFTSAYDM